MSKGDREEGGGRGGDLEEDLFSKGTAERIIGHVAKISDDASCLGGGGNIKTCFLPACPL